MQYGGLNLTLPYANYALSPLGYLPGLSKVFLKLSKYKDPYKSLKYLIRIRCKETGKIVQQVYHFYIVNPGLIPEPTARKTLSTIGYGPKNKPSKKNWI